jgi:hypothetical protein
MTDDDIFDHVVQNVISKRWHPQPVEVPKIVLHLVCIGECHIIRPLAPNIYRDTADHDKEIEGTRTFWRPFLSCAKDCIFALH